MTGFPDQNETRLLESEHAQLLLARTLQAVGAILTSQLGLREVLEKILDYLGDVVRYDSASIQLFDNQGVLSLAAGRGFEDLEAARQVVRDLSAKVQERWKTARLIVLADTHSDPRWLVVPGAEHIHAWVGAPLLVKGRFIGVLNVDSRVPGAYDVSTGETVMAFANQAAIAIENTRLFEQAAAERRHLGLLYDIGRELAATLDPDEILRQAISLTCQALDGLIGQAFLYRPDLDRLELRAVYGNGQCSLEQMDGLLDLSSERGLESWVIRNRQGYLVPDVVQDPHWLNVPGLSDPVRSAVSAPILEGDRLMGVLTVLDDRPAAFSADHLALLVAICQQVSLALSNASRYGEVERLAAQLAAQQERLESMVAHLPVGVLLLDDENRLLLSNPMGRSILADLNARISGERLTHLGALSLDSLNGQDSSHTPVEVTLEGPPNRYYKIDARSIGSERGIDCRQRVLMLREITQEREAQTRIQMQERMATVGQLAAGIAHDFNNIMAAILVYTDLLLREPRLPPVSRERLGVIQQQVDRATSLIRQILDFSRRSVMEPCPLDFLPFIKELDKMLARVLPENIRLELTYQPGSYRVNADPTRLQQVFMNLALNARDAMPAGGSLRFELGRVSSGRDKAVHVPGLPEGEWVCVCVKDTGAGIPPELLPHVFEPFFTTKPVGQGTGLGLAQVYGIVEQHGGFINVRSQLGQGTVFTLCLPALADPPERPTAEIPLETYQGAGETVLLVEDDPVTREALRDLLVTQNYRVQAAQDGLEALRCFEADPQAFAVVVSDLVMPEMGGVDLFRSLQERRPGIKMLFITGHPVDGASRSLLEKGGVAWLQKPFSISDLSRAMRELLART